MLLMTIKMTRLHWRGEMKNDCWRLLVGFPTPSDYNSVGNLTVDAQLRLWDAAGWCNCLKTVILGQVIYLVSRLPESGKTGPLLKRLHYISGILLFVE